jgi:hypothetical protein
MSWHGAGGPSVWNSASAEHAVAAAGLPSSTATCTIDETCSSLRMQYSIQLGLYLCLSLHLRYCAVSRGVFCLGSTHHQQLLCPGTPSYRTKSIKTKFGVRCLCEGILIRRVATHTWNKQRQFTRFVLLRVRDQRSFPAVWALKTEMMQHMAAYAASSNITTELIQKVHSRARPYKSWMLKHIVTYSSSSTTIHYVWCCNGDYRRASEINKKNCVIIGGVRSILAHD